MRVFVEYRVSVLVEVDPEQERIAAVEIQDQVIDGPFAVFDIDAEVPVRGADGRRAVRLAEDLSWPAWTLG